MRSPDVSPPVKVRRTCAAQTFRLLSSGVRPTWLLVQGRASGIRKQLSQIITSLSAPQTQLVNTSKDETHLKMTALGSIPLASRPRENTQRLNPTGLLSGRPLAFLLPTRAAFAASNSLSFLPSLFICCCCLSFSFFLSPVLSLLGQPEGNLFLRLPGKLASSACSLFSGCALRSSHRNSVRGWPSL